MFRKLVWTTALLALATVIFLRCTRSGGSSHALVGSTAPGFELASLDGGETSLESLRGKIVLLDFWATWCGPCRLTMPLLEKLQEEFPTDLVLLAVNLRESAATVRDYARSQGLKSLILLDSNGEVGSLYGSRSIPMQVLIDAEGVVRHVQIGYHPRMTEELREQIHKLRGAL
jgi:thiol-disulfide isomerase/thioredoxin